MTTVKRLQIDVSMQSFERLKNLKEQTGASSYAEVTNKSYKMYEYFMNAIQNNKEIVLKSSDGTETKVEFL